MKKLDIGADRGNIRHRIDIPAPCCLPNRSLPATLLLNIVLLHGDPRLRLRAAHGHYAQGSRLSEKVLLVTRSVETPKGGVSTTLGIPQKARDSRFSHSFNNNYVDDRDQFLENATASAASLRGLITSIPER